ncbi:UNC93-like protein MFSD11 [Convolutriloba macropyga]|uniref:UNC93-like protein MFSD11 n=1 Tax=Convolutriloba macropyga TaxID=536237 RepID=UPI003F52822F
MMFGGKVPKNTMIISLGFFFMYSAFDSMTDIEESIIEGFQDGGHSFTGSGYYVLSVFNVSFAICAFFTPVLMDILGFKISLLVCAVSFTLFIGSHFYPIAAIVYPLSVLVGITTSLLWSTGFALLSVSCRQEYVALNATIFYLTAQFSYALGSLYIFTVLYLDPSSADDISDKSRIISIAGYTAFSVIGLFTFQLASVPSDYVSSQERSYNLQTMKDVFGRALKTGFDLLKDRNFSCICIIFLFTGLSQSFMTGVYNTSIAHTLSFNDNKIDSKAMVGLSGVALGCGEVISGFFKVFLLSNSSSLKRRMRLCLAAFICFNTSHFMIILNLPDETPYKDSYSSAYISSSPNPYIAVICSFLIGLSDFVYQSELFATIGELGGTNEAVLGMATVFYSFLQGIGGMSAFLYAGSTGLLFQISILAVLNFFSILVFLFRDKAKQILEGPLKDDELLLESDSEPMN